jgi:hypothetical protein
VQPQPHQLLEPVGWAMSLLFIMMLVLLVLLVLLILLLLQSSTRHPDHDEGASLMVVLCSAQSAEAC